MHESGAQARGTEVKTSGGWKLRPLRMHPPVWILLSFS